MFNTFKKYSLYNKTQQDFYNLFYTFILLLMRISMEKKKRGSYF